MVPRIQAFVYITLVSCFLRCGRIISMISLNSSSFFTSATVKPYSWHFFSLISYDKFRASDVNSRKHTSWLDRWEQFCVAAKFKIRWHTQTRTWQKIESNTHWACTGITSINPCCDINSNDRYGISLLTKYYWSQTRGLHRNFGFSTI